MEGDLKPDPSTFSKPFSPDWPGSRNVPNPTSNETALQLARGHHSLKPLKWAMGAILGGSSQHLDLESIRCWRMTGLARKTYGKHLVLKWGQQAWAIPMFLKCPESGLADEGLCVKGVCRANMALDSNIQGEEWDVEGQMPSSKWE